MNMGIKRNAEDLIEVLKPIATALDFMEGNLCNLANCCVIWKDLERKLYELLRRDKVAKKMFQSRYEKSVTDAHLAAYLISPRMALPQVEIKSKKKSIDLDKVELSDEESNRALAFIEETFNLTFMPMLFKFMARSVPFKSQSFGEGVLKSLNDTDWWVAQSKLTDIVSTHNLEDIKRLTTAVASSAGVERTFSKFGLIHTKLRNKLGNEKCGKLVFVSQQINNNG